MTFGELKAELAARGFDYLSDDRQAQYTNWAIQELNDADFWPYRLLTTVGAAPLNLFPNSGGYGTDAGPIQAVFNTDTTPNTRLLPADRESLEHMYGDLSTTGTPVYYYADRGLTDVGVAFYQVKTYPASTVNLSVRVYLNTVTRSDDDAEILEIPQRWHRTIVDIAVRMAYRDSDNHDAADRLQGQIDRDITTMRVVLLTENTDGPDGYIHTTECW